MVNKIKKWLEGALITAYILVVPVLIGGAVYLKKQVDILHDHGYHLSEDIRHTQLHLDKVEMRSLKPLEQEVIRLMQHYKRHTHPEYKKAMQEIQRLIKLVKENGEYCVKKGDIGCRN